MPTLTYSTYSAADTAEVIALWNESIGSDFPMDTRLWEQNVNRSAYTWFEASIVARENSGKLVGVLIAKKPNNICCIVVDPLFRRQGIGSALFQRAVLTKPLQGSPWIVGQDRNHFFPGVPTELENAIAFFEKGVGFKRDAGQITDLNCHLANFSIEARVSAKITELQAEQITIQPCESSDITSLREHIASNFSQRWLDDTNARLATEANPSEIMVAVHGVKRTVIGFAHTYTNKSKFIGPSIYWRGLLGENYGGLGPIGVDKDHRKIGLGLALLAASIQSVKERGATEMAIDWTVLVDFYAKVGFKPWKTYVGVRQD